MVDLTDLVLIPESHFGVSNKTTGDNSWAVEYRTKDGGLKFDISKNRICLADYNYHSDKYRREDITPVNFHFALRIAPEAKKDCNEFFEYIFNPKISPWKSIIPKDGIHWDKPTSTKIKVPICTIPINKNTPVQVLFSLLVTARECQENPWLVYMFNELRKHDFTEAEALYVAVHYGLTKAGEVILAKNRNHSPFCVGEDLTFKRLKDGNPRFDNEKLFGHRYSNFASIFHEEDWGFYNGAAQPAQIYKKMNKELEYTGNFGKRFKDDNPSGYLPNKDVPTLQQIIDSKKVIFA